VTQSCELGHHRKTVQSKKTCALVEINPRVFRRAPKRSEDSKLRGRLKKLSSERRRFGYRRLHLLLKRGVVACVDASIYASAFNILSM
jgi:hypothetical protein